MSRPAPKLGERIEKLLDPASTEITRLSDDERTMRFVASDETVDRYGDIIRADGWMLDNFQKAGGPLLWAHMSREPPIGGVTRIWVEGKRLMADVKMLAPGKSERADVVWAGMEAGFLRAVSVGFAPTKMPNDLKDPATNAWTGWEFVEQELLELSVVPVPANPQAIAVAKSLGLGGGEARRFWIEPDPRALAQAAFAGRRRRIRILELGDQL